MYRRNTYVAFLLVKVEPGKEKEVLDMIVERFRENVSEARITYGEYDIVVRIEAATMRSLDAVIRAIRMLPGIVSTVTLLAA